MKTIIATYATASDADKALHALTEIGVRKEDISILTLDSRAKGELEGSSVVGKASDDAATGALQGAKLGLVGGILVGVAALTIPGLGALLAIGPLAAALGVTGVVGTAVTGAGIGTAVGGIGAMIGSLTSAGVSETDAAGLDKDLRAGAVVLSAKEQVGVDVNAAMNAGSPTRMTMV